MERMVVGLVSLICYSHKATERINRKRLSITDVTAHGCPRDHKRTRLQSIL